MKPCSRHSHDLLGALRKKGMGHLVNPANAKVFAERWIAGTATKPEFDPYVVATLEIFKKCKDMNIYVLNGGCPLCTVNKALHNAGADTIWIDNVTDLMLLTAKVNQLVPA